MALSFQTRTVGDIAVVTCTGRIVEGAESAALGQQVGDVLKNSSAVVLHLGGVDFVDSAGLGLLVRILARAGNDNLKLCALSTRLVEVLRITKLSAVFDCHESEADAIAAFYKPPKGSDRSPQLLPPNILCVEKSPDLLTYVQELLQQAGFRVGTTDNLPDAVILLKAMTPNVVVVSSELRSTGSAGTVQTFNRLVNAVAIVELPADFASQDPGETGQPLVDRIRTLIEGTGQSKTAAC